MDDWNKFKDYIKYHGGSVKSLANFIGVSEQYLRYAGKKKNLNKIQINYIKEYLKMINADASFVDIIDKYSIINNKKEQNNCQSDK